MNCVGRKIPLLKQDDGVPLRAFANDRELSEVTIRLKSEFSTDLLLYTHIQATKDNLPG